MSVQEEAVRAIEAQQAKEKPRSAVWMVGEQLKDICRREHFALRKLSSSN